MRIALAFAQFGPYHHARARALAAACEKNGDTLDLIEIASDTTTYAWKRETGSKSVITLVSGDVEHAGFLQVFRAAFRVLRERKIQCILLPSYSPASSLALFAAAKVCGCRTVMMNESHAGTERARGWKRWIKKWLVSQFDAALVGGSPHARHFAKLGILPDRISLGYDAIDNDHFSTRASQARLSASETRKRLGLPARYILSLGRMVDKKNLITLVRAYALLVAEFDTLSLPCPALVFVGDGETAPAIRETARSLGLPIYDHTLVVTSDSPHATRNFQSDFGASVHFYGFRQIEENPEFYALAECFVLPSLYEEWGLVVNEAMACGLPVVVSKTAGCAEDLVIHGENGYQFDPENPKELARCLIKVVENPELRRKMGLESQKIIANWGCDRFADGARQAIAAAMRC